MAASLRAGLASAKACEARPENQRRSQEVRSVSVAHGRLHERNLCGSRARHRVGTLRLNGRGSPKVSLGQVLAHVARHLEHVNLANGKISFNAPSGLMMRPSFNFLALMYAQSFFVTSVRGIFFPPQIAASFGLKFTGAKRPMPFFF